METKTQNIDEEAQVGTSEAAQSKRKRRGSDEDNLRYFLPKAGSSSAKPELGQKPGEQRGPGEREASGHANSLTRRVSRQKLRRTTMNTKKHTISVDQIQNLEIDRNGRVMPRLNDLDPLENTLLSVLYPGVRVASVNVPVEPLDEYEESKVENALAKLVWRGIHYKLVGASGSAKKGKFYFVDHEHSRAIAERFQHWPQAAIVYFGILVSSCKVMMEESDARVLVVPDHSLGTNDCRGWIRRTAFGRLQQKHDSELLDKQVNRLLQQERGEIRETDLSASVKESLALEDKSKSEIAGKTLRAQRFYQFSMAFHDTQAKGSFKIMDDDVADALETDFILPESAVKPGLKKPAVMYSIVRPRRSFRGRTVVGIREFSRQLEFESSDTLVEPPPDNSVHLT